MDASPYDQNESRELNAVDDIRLRCDIRAEGEGKVVFRLNSPADEFIAQLDVETGEGELMHNGQVASLIAAPMDPFTRFTHLEMILADHRIELTRNHSSLVEYDYDPPAVAPRPPGQYTAPPVDQPLAIGAQGARVEIQNLEVLRDVYYTGGPMADTSTTYQLGGDEYFVLGDNSPQAVDSRVWSPCGLSGKLLVGRVLAW